MRRYKKNLNEVSNIMAKCLVSPQSISLKDLKELSKHSFGDLVVKFDLSEFEAQCLISNLKLQMQRFVNQNLFYPAELRDTINESHDMNSILDTVLSAFSDLTAQPETETGKMLDYGTSKSDSEEGKMFRSTLYTLISDTEELYHITNDNDDIPQWCHYKIAEAKMMISTVRDYLSHKIDTYDQ